MDPVTALLSKMDDRLARQDEILAQMGAILLEMRASNERISQHTVQIAQLCTEHTLSFARLIEVSQAILTRVEGRR
jgi:hypothetical protein